MAELLKGNLFYAGFVCIGELEVDAQQDVAIGEVMPDEGAVVQIRQTPRGIGVASSSNRKCSYFVVDRKTSDAIDNIIEQGWEVTAVMAEKEYTKRSEKYYVNISGLSPDSTAMEAQRYRACVKMDKFGAEHPSLTSVNFDDDYAISYLKRIKAAKYVEQQKQQAEKEKKLTYRLGKMLGGKRN